MKDKQGFQQRMKVIAKLMEAGCQNEKQLLSLGTEGILQIQGITISDMTIILELQKHTKSGKLFSYLAGFEEAKDGQEG